MVQKGYIKFVQLLGTLDCSLTRLFHLQIVICIYFRNEYIESVTLQDHKNFISYIYYLASEQWICTASNDATICIYNQEGFVPLLTLKGHESTVCALAGGLQSRSIISGSWDKTARVWTISEPGILRSSN